MAGAGPHADRWGDQGPTVVLVHGSFAADPAWAWREQRPLADRYRLIVAHRRGYGQSSGVRRPVFEDDVGDVVALLGEGAHLVGFSYGGVISHLVAGSRPELVRSLTLIEPPAFGLVPNDPAVAAMVERLSTIYPPERFTLEEYRANFLWALRGTPKEPVPLSPEERQATIAAMAEAPPWEAPIDVDAVAAAPFSKLIVSGAWDPALDAVAYLLARRLDAEHAVITGAGHAVHQTGEPFNQRLRALWEAEDGPLSAQVSCVRDH